MCHDSCCPKRTLSSTFSILHMRIHPSALARVCAYRTASVPSRVCVHCLFCALLIWFCSVCLLCAYRMQRASAYWKERASPTAKSRKSAFFAGAPAHVCICVCESPRRAPGRGWGQDITVYCMQRRTDAGVRRPCHDFTLFACQYTVISCMQMHCEVSCWRATPLS